MALRMAASTVSCELSKYALPTTRGRGLFEIRSSATPRGERVGQPNRLFPWQGGLLMGQLVLTFRI